MTQYIPEKAVLGAVLLDNSALSMVSWLAEDDFELDKHRLIFAAMLQLGRRGTPIDHVTLGEQLKQNGMLNRIGGAKALADLTDAVATTANVDYYAQLVHQRATIRKMGHSAARITEIAAGNLDSDAIDHSVGQIRQYLTQLENRRSQLDAPAVHQFLNNALGRMMRRAEGKERPIELPWASLNTALKGGLWPGMYVVVGSTGTGKSQFALQIALHAAKNSIPALYIGLELGHDDLIARLIGIESGRKWSRLWLGEESQEIVQAAIEHSAMLQRLPLHLSVASPHGWPYNKLYPTARALREQYSSVLNDEQGPKQPFLVVLDFLQLVSSPQQQRGEDLRQRIQRAAYEARAVARDLNAAVLLVSSTARENYGKLKIKSQDDLPPPYTLVGLGKESGEIEYAADGVLVLVRQEAEDKGDPPSPTVHLAMAKARAGIPSWLQLNFDGGRFIENEYIDNHQNRGITWG